MSAKDLYSAFGVSASTGGAKSKLVRDTLGMHQMDPDWCLPSKLDNNLMAWMISVNGLMMDARSVPRYIQEEAFEKGLIPYLPGDKEDFSPRSGAWPHRLQRLDLQPLTVQLLTVKWLNSLPRRFMFCWSPSLMGL